MSEVNIFFLIFFLLLFKNVSGTKSAVYVDTIYAMLVLRTFTFCETVLTDQMDHNVHIHSVIRYPIRFHKSNFDFRSQHIRPKNVNCTCIVKQSKKYLFFPRTKHYVLLYLQIQTLSQSYKNNKKYLPSQPQQYTL